MPARPVGALHELGSVASAVAPIGEVAVEGPAGFCASQGCALAGGRGLRPGSLAAAGHATVDMPVLLLEDFVVLEARVDVAGRGRFDFWQPAAEPDALPKVVPRTQSHRTALLRPGLPAAAASAALLPFFAS